MSRDPARSNFVEPHAITTRSAAALSVATLLAATLFAVAPVTAHAQDGPAPAPLETIRNWQTVDERLSSSGQIGYDQIPLLAEQGFEVVVNLAVADEERNGNEGFLVAENGLTYVHIPVDWERPTVDDVALFLDVMEANRSRKVYVHCFANMRASAFVYLYRTMVEGVPEAAARATMHEVWNPDELDQWGALIRDARRELAPRR